MKWFNIGDYADKLKPITIVISGRGVGKTYSALNFCIEQESPFLYMRNTDTQIMECCNDFGNPFKRINSDKERDIKILREHKHSVIVEGDKILGYASALSTFANMRGVDLSDVRYLVFDEFIEHSPLRFEQFTAFVNMYETINRNRELLGEPPLITILLSNAQKLGNPILAGFGVIGTIEGMIQRGQQKYTDKDIMILLPQSDVSEEKKNTALYRLTTGTRYYNEAIENKFSNDSFVGVVKRPLVEYYPITAIDGLYIYRHKSRSVYYVSRSAANVPHEYNDKDEHALFMRGFGAELRESAMVGKVEYCDFTAKVQLFDILAL